MQAELKPCPFCGVRLNGEMDDGASFHTHPKNDCWYSEYEFDQINVEKWNRRAAPVAPPGAQEVAPCKFDGYGCGITGPYCAKCHNTAPVPATTPAEQPEGDSMLAAPDRLYRAAPRGIGKDWTPGCMCCGGGKQLYNNISFFVPSRETGEAIVGLFKTGAFLDWREFEPNWIQVKVGACDSHIDNLRQLFDAVRNGPQQDGKTCISASIIERATATNTNQPEGAPVPTWWHRADQPWDCYPVGTKARESWGAGFWIKTEHGWKWHLGSTFPTPGGADEVLYPLENLGAANTSKGGDA